MENTKEEIRKSLKILKDVEEHREIIEDFAIRHYNHKFKGSIFDKSYESFDVISETELRVWYSYDGGGEMRMNESFKVKIVE